MLKEILEDLNEKLFSNTIGKVLNQYGYITNDLYYYKGTYYLGGTVSGGRLSVNRGNIDAYSNFSDSKWVAEQVSDSLSRNSPEIKKLKKILLKTSTTILCKSNLPQIIKVDIKTGNIIK